MEVFVFLEVFISTNRCGVLSTWSFCTFFLCLSITVFLIHTFRVIHDLSFLIFASFVRFHLKINKVYHHFWDGEDSIYVFQKSITIYTNSLQFKGRGVIGQECWRIIDLTTLINVRIERSLRILVFFLHTFSEFIYLILVSPEDFE